MNGPLLSALHKVVERKDLHSEEAEGAMEEIISGRAPPAVVGAFLAALRTKGETVDEVVAFARVMERFSFKVSPKVEGMLVDTCGTGGDRVKTMNVSTAAMFVAAGAGVPIAKHGNRAVTGRVGSADLLEAIGARIDLPPQEVERCIQEAGVGFMFAPRFHPAAANVAAVRRELGFRTVFNLLGPLTNPANVKVQLLGVCAQDLVEKMVLALRELGRARAMVVFGMSGVDEISITGETLISELNDGRISSYVIRPEDLGMRRIEEDRIRGGDLERNIRMFLGALLGQPGGARDMVLLNAGAVIFLGGRASSMQEGVLLAAESVESGRAYRKVEDFVRATGGDLQKLREWRERCGLP
ncbi:MAG: anthranilate phosphoribosyltransferase [Candidatus Hadarchaeales archaeon]